jgi:hypothetical protein
VLSATGLRKLAGRSKPNVAVAPRIFNGDSPVTEAPSGDFTRDCPERWALDGELLFWIPVALALASLHDD